MNERDREERKGVSPWKWILAGSAATLLILAGAAWALLAYAVPQGKAQLARLLEEQVARERDSRIPEACRALLREMGELAGRPEASFPSVLLLEGVTDDALADHKVSAAEQADLVLVRDFVKKENVAVSFGRMGVFINEHPGIKLILNRHTPPVPTPIPAAEDKATSGSLN